jgi:hypothetical protein
MGNYQLFLPTQLGGLGFDHYPEVGYELTNFQRQLANYLARKLDNMAGTDYATVVDRSIRLVQTNVPKSHSPFNGTVYLKCIPLLQPIPEGYQDIESSDTELFMTTDFSSPQLSYKFISTQLLREFRANKPQSLKNKFEKYIGEFNRFNSRLIIKEDLESYHLRLVGVFSHPEYCLPCKNTLL